MQVKVLEEHGYESALRGMAYSYKDRSLDPDDWWQGQKDRAEKRAVKLAPMEGGHNKFLESIQVWLDIEAPRSFWQEFDTYRVGTTKQSESTMHTLGKRKPTYSDFETGTTLKTMDCFIEQWEELKGNVIMLKENLPEGYLQRRIVCTNYKVLKNILFQREGHRYLRWQQHKDQILAQIEHPELLGELK